ncbi:hypothetical protein PR003_g19611 [Phytophthora rubi]|uniref:RNase H type-1 domain-containing protein n=1 Tax=Phytophthora rubi TaxID=129364 RepID=A0A6A4DUE1_9STRA|nr:hypothetical protein PR003_g19611 [Phytophthora rubi]
MRALAGNGENSACLADNRLERPTRCGFRASCSAHAPVVLWVPREELPREAGYARVESDKYREWQVLAYAESRDETLFGREGKLYLDWLAAQPSAVERREYPTPRALLRRPTEALVGTDVPGEGDDDRIVAVNCLDPAETTDEANECRSPSVDTKPGPAVNGGQDPGPFEGYATEEIAERPKLHDPVVGVRFGDSARPPGEPGEILTSVTACSDSRTDKVGGCEATEPWGDSEAEVTTDRASTDPTDERSIKSDAERLKAVYVSVMAGGSPETVADADWGSNDTAEHLPNEIELTDYARNTDLRTDQQAKLVAVLQQHEEIMIASGNALPPPAYGVVCDIDVQGHPPIKQKARRTPLRFLGKLYELLKGLLTASLVSFSDSPWASPTVIVLKKNGIDIRLCIDYKRVNAITAIMEYAMPQVDDLLTEMEAYLWFCSLDAASGFWAVMMTRRARTISAFVCALGHFEWLRMPFGLKNAPMIYQRMIDNALWGFAQPKGGWANFSEKMRIAEATDTEDRAGVTDASVSPNETPRTKFEADRALSTTESAVATLLNSPLADMYSSGEPDESSLGPVLDRRSFVDDICFGSETFDACLATLDRLLSRFQECRISVSFSESLFVQRKVGFLSHDVSAAGITPDAKKAAAVTELSFPASKKEVQSILGALNYYSRFIQDFAVYGAALYQLKDADFEPGGDLSAARQSFAMLQQRVRDAPILRHFDRGKDVHVTLFANEWALSSTLMQEHEGKLHPVRFCGRVLKDAEMNYHPAEKEVLALLLVLKVCYTQLVGKSIRVYTRFSTLEWVHKSKTLFGRATQFAVLLSPWHLVVERVKEKDCAFAQLLQAGLTSFVDLDESLASVAPPSKRLPNVRLDPHLLYARLPTSYSGHVLSFDGSAKTEKHGGYGSCSWVLWKLPEWTIVIAASAYLETTTVNLAEFAGMNNGVSAALGLAITDLVIVGDSRLAIQQSLGVIACRKETLMAQLNYHRELVAKLRSVKYLHAIREFNAAADSLVSETLESKTSAVTTSEARIAELRALNRINEVIYETSVDGATEEKPSVSVLRASMTREDPRRKTFFYFVRTEDRDSGYVTVATRHQAKTKTKRVRFANEVSVIGQDEAARLAESNAVPNEAQDVLEETLSPTEALAAAMPAPPEAEDVDPLLVQDERRRRVAAAQDDELR